MAKQKTEEQLAKIKVKDQKPPRIEWKHHTTDILKREWYRPIVFVANIAFPLEPRPFKGWKKNERDAVMTWITMAVSEVLFGHPKYITNEKGQMHKNPDWVQLTFYQETEQGEWLPFQLEHVSISQQVATDKNNGPITL